MSFELTIILKVTAIFGVTALASLALRRASASTRHMVWSIGFLAALILPFGLTMLPVVDLPVLPPVSVDVVPVVSQHKEVAVSEVIETTDPTDPVARPSEADIRESQTVPPVNTKEWELRRLLGWVWVFGSLVALLRLVSSIWSVSRLRRQLASTLAAEWNIEIEGLKRDLSVKTPVEVRIASSNVPPMTCGLLRQTILLPVAATQWTDERRRLVLLHELAHVSRHDGLVQVFVQIVCAFYWFHPGVWLAARRMRLERERACDDMVLNLGVDAGTYVDHLLDIVREINSGFPSAAISMAHPWQLESRLRAILDSRARRRRLSRRHTAMLVASFTLIAVAFSSIELTAVARLKLSAIYAEPVWPRAESRSAPVTSPQILGLSSQTQETRLQIQTPASADSVSLSISPDGDKIVFAAISDGKYQLWLHSLVSGTSRPLPGTDGIKVPFSNCWSPDSKSIAFFGDRFKRIDIETGAMQYLENSSSSPSGLAQYARNLFNSGSNPPGRGCSWNSTGTILYAVASDNSILQVSDQGGSASRATPPTPYGLMHPHFLPDGFHFLYYAQGGGVFVGELGGTTPKKLFDADTAAVYSRSGHLLFVRDGKLYAQGFEPAELKLVGGPFVVANRAPMVMSVAAVSTSSAGPIAFRSGEGGNLRQFKWFDRTGHETGTVGEPTPVEIAAPDLSPDGQSVAFDRVQGGNIDIWIIELKTGKFTRFTSDPANDFFPIWSADGKTIFFSSNRTGQNELYEKPADGSAPEKLVMNDRMQRAPRGVSQDGRSLLVALTNTLIVQLDSIPRREFAFAPNARFPQFSPDSRWVAYSSYPIPDVYIQQVSGGRRVQVTTNGGGHVRWRADGKELFFVDGDGRLMAVPIELAANGQDITVGKPEALFTPPMMPNVLAPLYAQQYLVAPDGQHFLIATAAAEAPPITVIRNWQSK